MILPECDIGRGCQLKKCIIDRGVFLPPDTRVGIDHDEDRRRGFRVSDKGVVLVTPTMMGQPLHTTR
ncbi:MAG: hypothetical protein R3E84_17785 [Pseudomonadales bacterium]